MRDPGELVGGQRVAGDAHPHLEGPPPTLNSGLEPIAGGSRCRTQLTAWRSGMAVIRTLVSSRVGVVDSHVEKSAAL